MTNRRLGTFIAAAIYLIAVAITLLVSILWADDSGLTASWWIGLSAVLLAETALWQFTLHLMRSRDRAKRMVPGYLALGVVIAAYLAAVLIYACVAAIADWRSSALLLLHALTLACAAIVGLLVVAYIRYASQQDERSREQTLSFKELELRLQELLQAIRAKASTGQAGIVELEQAMALLVEKVRYSDPVVPPALAHLDFQLLEEIEGMLRFDMKDNPLSVSVPQIEQLTQRMEERNARVLAMK